MSQVIHGDSVEVLKTLEADSVDLVCTDPPYGIGFMGKEWDTFTPEHVNKMLVQNKKRPLRTDGRTVPMGGPSRDAGTYDYRKNSQFQKFITETFTEVLRVMKPGAFVFMTMAPRQDVLSRAMLGLEDAGFNIGFTSMYWTFASGFPKAMNIGKMVDKRKGIERDELPTLPMQKKGDVGEISKNRRCAICLKAISSGSSCQCDRRTRASTDAAKTLDGSYGGFQPKPAVEVIIVAMKPLSEKTYVDQALKNGKGITWLDDCRIPTIGEILDAGGRGKHGRGEGYGFEALGEIEIDQSKGRFPANLLVSDDVLNDGKITKSTVDKSSHAGRTGTSTFAGDEQVERVQRGDTGSYSRFFDLDAWASTLPFLIVPKASKREKNNGLQERVSETVSDGRPVAIDNAFQRGKTERKNIHPTVKPIKLMSYLITLGSRPGDVVLDPFLGSGTTAVAAKELGREYIGIEREQEYVAIAEARIAAVHPSFAV